MRILILAVGKLKERHWADAADEYIKRLGAYANVDIVELSDRDISRDAVAAKRVESESILKAIPAGYRVVALDERGKQHTSKQLASRIEDMMVGGTSSIAFVVGGSAGLDQAVLDRADERLSLSSMTFPHQMARVVLLEQVYRAFKIIRGEPYHL